MDVTLTKNPMYILLKKYAQHVRDCEGIDFIEKIGNPESEVEFTDNEKLILLSIHESCF